MCNAARAAGKAAITSRRQVLRRVTVASALAGYICAAISKNQRTCELFAGVILVILILFCIPKMRDRAPHPRAGEVSYMDAMRLTQMPLWMHALNPVLGALGVLVGARMKKLP